MNYVKRAILRMLKLDTPSIQASIECTSDDIQDDVEVVQTYGFNAVPPDNVTEAIVLNVNGHSDHSVLISFIDKQNRPLINKGEAQMYAKTDAGISTITFKKNGDIEINPANNKLIINANIEVNGKIDATGDVKAGSISLQNHTHPQNNGNDYGGGVNTGASQ
jgi:phage gp45-like